MSQGRTIPPSGARQRRIRRFLTAQYLQSYTPPRWWELVGRWLRRIRERDELSHLDERERRDAGITAYDVAIECRKPFWRE